MKTYEIITLMLSIFILFPIQIFLYYKVLLAVKATELMWFLFWVYIPLAIIMSIIIKVIEKND